MLSEKRDSSCGGAEQRGHQHVGIDGAGFGLQHEADFLVRFVADIGQQREFLLVQEQGDLLDEAGFLHLIGDFGDDDDPGAVFLRLLHPARAGAQRAAPGLVGVQQGGLVLDQLAAGREIRAAQVLQQLLRGGLRVFDQVDGGSADLARVMRRDGGRHADGDAGRAVGQQVREGAGQDDGLAFLAVIGRAEIHRVLVDAAQQQLGDLGQAGFGVAHRRRVIAVDIAEIALAFDQREAGGEILREADQRLVDRGIAVRVEFTHDVADHAGAFLEARARVQFELVHGVDEPAMHGFEAVAHVRQRAGHDGGEGVSEVALGQRAAEWRVFDMACNVIRHFFHLSASRSAIRS